jgi:hypothetical protein
MAAHYGPLEDSIFKEDTSQDRRRFVPGQRSAQGTTAGRRAPTDDDILTEQIRQMGGMSL